MGGKLLFLLMPMGVKMGTFWCFLAKILKYIEAAHWYGIINFMSLEETLKRDKSVSCLVVNFHRSAPSVLIIQKQLALTLLTRKYTSALIATASTTIENAERLMIHLKVSQKSIGQLMIIVTQGSPRRIVSKTLKSFDYFQLNYFRLGVATLIISKPKCT